MAAGSASNLPTQTTSFVGRDQQIEEVRGLLQKPECRLLTLMGPGGIGKTRLAIAVAETCEMPVIYVPLQSVQSVELTPSAIADVAGITLGGDEPLAVQLVNNLRDRRLLLVLDNFEHLLDATALLLDILLEAPEVKLLITSREALAVREEWLYVVPGLPFPPADEQDDALPEQTGAYESVQLFVERARQVRQGFRLEDDTESVVAICRAVDGMPLAIELVASWARILDSAAIAKQVQGKGDVLDTPMRNVPERHRSMRAVFDASWQMLSPQEREVFAKLAVFQGGSTLDAAAQIAGATVSMLSSLTSKSLVYVNPDGRYRIHELLRQYALEKLPGNDMAAAERAHSNYFMRFLADREHHFHDARQISAAKDIANDLDNIRVSWQWSIDNVDSQSILSAGTALHHFCQHRSYYVEGVEMFASAAQRLETDELTVERAEALVVVLKCYGWLCLRVGRVAEAEHALGRATQIYDDFGISPGKRLQGYPGLASLYVALTRGDYSRAVSLGQEVLQVATQYADPSAAAAPHHGLASAYLAQNDLANAKWHAEQALSLSMAESNQHQSIFSRTILGKIALAEGDLGSAKSHFEAAYEICEERENLGGQAEYLMNLATIALLQLDWRRARLLLSQSLGVYEEVGDKGGIALSHLGLGTVARETDEMEATRTHYDRALRIATGAQIGPVIVAVLAAVGDLLLNDSESKSLGLRALRYALVHPSCDERTRRQIDATLADSGSASDVRDDRISDETDEAPVDLQGLVTALLVALAVPEQGGTDIAGLIEALTKREYDVLRLLARGQTNPEIADALFVSVGTVKFHTSHIYSKLGVSNRTQAVQRARELGIIA